MFITIQAVPCCACGVEQKTPSPDQSLMFTRLDLERNAKIMKKAVMDQRLDADRYKVHCRGCVLGKGVGGYIMIMCHAPVTRLSQGILLASFYWGVGGGDTRITKKAVIDQRLDTDRYKVRRFGYLFGGWEVRGHRHHKNAIMDC